MMSAPASASPNNPLRARCRPRWALVAGGVLAAAGGLLFAWWVWLGPYGHTLPDPLPGAGEADSYPIFAYGTLRNPFVRWLIIGRRVDTHPAALPGYRKEALDVLPDPDSTTEGIVFEVDLTELRRLDRYERLGTRYERVRLPLENGSAWVYRRLP